MRLIPTALFLLALPGAAMAQSTPAERTMVQTVAAEQDRHVALLERMVNQNSGTLNLTGVRAVGEMVRAELEPLGFEVRWVDMAETGRAGHLIATKPGRGRNVLLIGHLDTVFEPDSPFQTFQRDGDRATGPGIGDDKGGVVVIIAALRAMQAAGTLSGSCVTVVLTGDEERPGSPLSIARKDLIEAGRSAGWALEFENLATENGQEFGTVARRSSSSWTLTTEGRTGHSSGVFNDTLGYGAVYEMARILDGFRRELPEPNLTYNVGVIAGGTPAEIDADGFRVSASGKTNIVASTAIARGDLRTLTPEQDARVRERMQGIVEQHLPRTEAELAFAEDGYPPMAPTEGNRALLARLNAVNRDLGLAEMAEYDPARRGAADSGFVAADVDTLGGLGMAGGNAHADGEWVDLSSLVRQAQRAAVLISRLSTGRP
ncbi:MAG TPA: M20/M25/M40 family metallo-hydrolase [Brevundimonas sp.]|nr:M20/M25/M40 family metallo-hydrolase [Brevundimonas sp.]